MIRRNGRFAPVLLAALLAGAAVRATGAEPSLRSGPQVGERPLPFTSNMVTGEHRGRQYCYVCELKDEPAALVFLRRVDPAAARLLRGLREAVETHRGAKLFAWVVFLGGTDAAAQLALERESFDLARACESTQVPVSVLGDPQGPPGYRIAPEAAATVLFFRSGKVLYNRAYRAKEWTAGAAGAALRDLPGALGL